MNHQKRGNSFLIYLITTIIICCFKLSGTYIVLPFKMNSPKNNDNISKIFNELLDNKLIISLPFGTPKKTMNFYASMNEYIYYLEEGSCNNDIISSYNMKESKTFKEKNKTFCGVNLDECYLGEDILYLYQDIKMKLYKELPLIFYYGYKKDNINKNDNKICGKIGFKIENGPFKFYDYDNFITLLKQKEIIHSYSWYIHYFDNNKINNFDGAIFLDIFNPNFFKDFPFLKKDDDYNTINAKDKENILAWTFDFDKIYYIYNETKFEFQIVNSGLAFETDFIHSPSIYFESIKKNFFDKLFNNNICFLVQERYYYIYCEKNSFENYKVQFPSLLFKSFGLNKTYILNPNELFKDYGNIYLFMIIHPRYSYKIWTLGKIFMKNNNFYFDNNKKLIGYFDNIKIEKKNYSNVNIFDKIKWIIFIFFGIIIGIFIGKKIREKTRKLRANELEDNYEYLENKIKGDKIYNDKDDNNLYLDRKSNYSEIKSI